MRCGGYYGLSGGTPPQCVDDFLLPLYSKKYLQYRSQICRIGSLLQKLASYCFWPHFEKQDGRHGRFIIIFGHFCCPCISEGMQCTLSKFSGYVYHAESFLGYDSGYLYKIKVAAVGVSLIVFLQNTRSANISKTIIDRAISSEFWTHREPGE